MALHQNKLQRFELHLLSYDMVRCQKYLEVIDEENLVKNAAVQGERLRSGLEEMAGRYPDMMSNVRGLGLMCAFDLPTTEMRDEFKNKLYANGLLVLPCGTNTIRFRPPLTISSEEVDEVLGIVDKTVKMF